MDRPLIVFDTETANAQGAPHLLEIGAVRVVDGEVEDSFQALVRPSVPIDPETTGVHGITDEDVRDADTAPEVLERFTAWVGNEWMAAHNAGADTRVLGFEFARHGLQDMPAAPVLDSLALAFKHIPEADDHKLPTLCEHLDLEEGEMHRALFDATSCWKVIEECMERRGGLEGTRMAELLAEGGAPTTIPERRPPAPRLNRRLRRLERSIETGEDVTLVYGDSASIPANLPVTPRFLFERHKKGYLEAECLQSGMLKTYLLTRIQRVTDRR